MLRDLFQELDDLLARENLRRSMNEDNVELLLSPCEFRILGQFALIEAQISKIATKDVDAKTNADPWILARFCECLKKRGYIWDADSDKITMPSETEYAGLFSGRLITALIAKPEYVLLSKAQFAPKKNKAVLAAYLAGRPTDLFFDLCKKYKVDLDRIID